jgi:hypothetical protein
LSFTGTPDETTIISEGSRLELEIEESNMLISAARFLVAIKIAKQGYSTFISLVAS